MSNKEIKSNSSVVSTYTDSLNSCNSSVDLPAYTAEGKSTVDSNKMCIEVYERVKKLVDIYREKISEDIRHINDVNSEFEQMDENIIQR